MPGLAQSDAGNQIRSAWRMGKKKLTLNGIDLSIALSVHNVVIHEKDGTHRHQKESWLIARPVDKFKFVPVYSVELEPGKNMRTAR